MTLTDFLFGCWHSNYSFPITDRMRTKRASQVTGTYIVCLDCGKEFPYDWKEMRVVDAQRFRNPRKLEIENSELLVKGTPQ